MRHLALLLLISGCSTSVALEDFCSQEWIARCEANKRCRLWSPAMECPLPPDTACTERMQRYVDAGVFTYDGAAAKKCLDAFERRSCEQLYDRPLESGDEACNRYFVGASKEDERCGGCVAGFVCLYPLGGNDPDACGTCRPKSLLEPAGIGASCDMRSCGSNAFCNAEKVCERLPGDGEACRDGKCRLPYRCSEDVCELPIGQGATCVVNEHCQGGLWCERGICQLQKVRGSACGAEFECRSGHCFEGTCVLLSEIDEPCGPGCAAPGVCVNGTCERGAEVGESCTDKPCALGNCIGGACREPTLECR
ncbi:MAG: hypothetical protein ACO1OB_03285 [Archangium sp.]